MSCPWVEEHLNDWLDEELPAAQRRRLEAHLSECAGCRRQAEELRSLCRRAAGLPLDIEPERDLWPEIAGRLPSRPGDRAPEGRRWVQRWAALLLIALAGGAWWWSRDRSGAPPQVPQEAIAGLASPALPGADFEGVLVQARNDLQRKALQGLGGGVHPRPDVLEDQLRVLDEAIREIRQAMAEDPGNLRLHQALVGSYRKQLELLETALRFSPQRRDSASKDNERRWKDEYA